MINDCIYVFSLKTYISYHIFLVPPMFKTQPYDTQALVGWPVLLDWVIIAKPEATLTWLRNDQTINQDKGRLQ